MIVNRVINAAGSDIGQLASGATQIPYLITSPLCWTLTNAPAANVAATATKAAGGAGVRHVLTSLYGAMIIATAANLTAAQPLYCVVRDGAAGAGTILFQYAGNGAQFGISGLMIMGSVNTAMTIEFTGASGLTNLQVVSGAGYSIDLA